MQNSSKQTDKKQNLLLPSIQTTRFWQLFLGAKASGAVPRELHPFLGVMEVGKKTLSAQDSY